jgi:hydrogenase maturation protease
LTDRLLIGYGNPGRGDDGLGPALVESLESLSPKGLRLISDYQLTVDLAYDIAPFETVIFADAAMTGVAPFSFRSIAPAAPLSFTSHSQRPEGVLYTAHALFGARTRAYLLGIRGYRFNEFNEVLSAGGRRNLEASLAFVCDRILSCPDAGILAEMGPA